MRVFSFRSIRGTISRFNIEMGRRTDASRTYSGGRIGTHIPLHVSRWSR